MRKLILVFALLFGSMSFIPMILPARQVHQSFLSSTMTRAELDRVIGECVREFGMCLNDLYVAYGRGDLKVEKVQTGIYSVELNGGGSILILLEDA